jgi:hypothetical protein
MKDETAYALTAIICVGILVVSMVIAGVMLKSDYGWLDEKRCATEIRAKGEK